jgi:hypothetical protein
VNTAAEQTNYFLLQPAWDFVLSPLVTPAWAWAGLQTTKAQKWLTGDQVALERGEGTGEGEEKKGLPDNSERRLREELSKCHSLRADAAAAAEIAARPNASQEEKLRAEELADSATRQVGGMSEVVWAELKRDVWRWLFVSRGAEEAAEHTTTQTQQRPGDLPDVGEEDTWARDIAVWDRRVGLGWIPLITHVIIALARQNTILLMTPSRV